jgi:hypothetical protein
MPPPPPSVPQPLADCTQHGIFPTGVVDHGVLPDAPLAAGYPQMFCTSPPPFAAEPWAIHFFFFFAGAAAVLAAIPWAIYAGVKKDNWVPIFVVASGFLTSLSEPMLDMLGHLRWANNLPTAFTNFGIDVPWLIPPCYAAFFGLEAYFCYYMLKKGITVNQAVMVFAIGGLTDAIMETMGLNLNIYEYYGLQPFTLFKFPYWWGFINGAAIFTVGFLHWWLVPKLHGVKMAWILVLSPAGMMMLYFTAGWPHILAANSTLPTPLKYIATTITLAACVGVVRFLASFAAVDTPTHNWTFLRMFFYRMMTVSARAKLDAKMAAEAQAKYGKAATPVAA